MINKIIFIFLIGFVACKEGKQQKQDSEPVGRSTVALVKDTLTKKGIVRWIRSEGERIPVIPDAIESIIGKGRKPIYSVKADINNDGREDIILVTAVVNEDDLLLETILVKREMLLLLAGENNSLTVASRTENAIPCINCYGMSHDAFAGVKAEKGKFTLLFFGGSNWKDTRASTFVYHEKKNDWYLDSEIEEHFFMDYQNYEVDTLTKKDFGTVPLSKFNIYKIYEID